MSFTATITLTTGGSGTGPFNLYSDVDSYVTPFETGLSKSVLQSGYISTLVPNGSTIVRIMSMGQCVTYDDITISGLPTPSNTPNVSVTPTPSPTPQGCSDPVLNMITYIGEGYFSLNWTHNECLTSVGQYSYDNINWTIGGVSEECVSPMIIDTNNNISGTMYFRLRIICSGTQYSNTLVYTFPTPTPSQTVTPTPSITPTPTRTPSLTPSITLTPTPTKTPSITPSITPSLTPSPSFNTSPSITPSPTRTPSITPTPSQYHSAFSFVWNITTPGERVALGLDGGGYSFTVNWGDGVTEVVTNSFDGDHTYSTSGFKTVRIIGNLPYLHFANNYYGRLTSIINWGNVGFNDLNFENSTYLTSLPSGAMTGVSGLNSAYKMFKGCTSLTSIPSGLFDNCINITHFTETFMNSGLLSIPTDLFKYNTVVGFNGFSNTFYGCQITSIPDDLFRYNVDLNVGGFFGTFYGCPITSIPTDLFKYNVNLSENGFQYTFVGSSITEIPVDLFRYNTMITNFAFGFTFQFCESLTSIPIDIFRYNTLVSDVAFYGTFSYCSSLTTIPDDIFRYNTLVSNDAFNSTFGDCILLESVPVNLFKYNTIAEFHLTFVNCNKLQLNRNIFFSDGEESTRFLNQSTIISNCFQRSSFTGIQGEAPHLWDCDFGTGTPNKTNCFNGAGNSSTSISNYGDIPIDWK